jgi:hypothetical protein
MSDEWADRAAHLEWCKQRAREYLDRGDWSNAWASFLSDMRKHDGTKDHLALELGMRLLIAGYNANVPEMRHWIEGFN